MSQHVHHVIKARVRGDTLGMHPSMVHQARLRLVRDGARDLALEARWGLGDGYDATFRQRMTRGQARLLMRWLAEALNDREAS
jgi:hypothetical protein